MAQQTIDNGLGGTVVRSRLNANFTELYSYLSTWINKSGATTVTTPTITGDVTFVGDTTFTGKISNTKTDTGVGDARPVMHPITLTVQPASAPGMTIDYHGIDMSMSASGNTNSDTNLYPMELTCGMDGTGTVGSLFNLFLNSRNTSTGTVTAMTGLRLRARNNTTGTVTNYYGIRTNDPINAGTFTNWYGLYLDDVTTTTNSYGIYSLLNNNYIKGLSLGDSPSALGTSVMMDMASTTKAPVLPRMTTAQRDLLTAVSGMIIYNTSTGKVNFRAAAGWEAITSV